MHCEVEELWAGDTKELEEARKKMVGAAVFISLPASVIGQQKNKSQGCLMCAASVCRKPATYQVLICQEPLSSGSFDGLLYLIRPISRTFH